MTKRQIASQLRKAAKVTRAGYIHGGHTGNIQDVTAPHCMLGALAAVGASDETTTVLGRALARRVRKDYSGRLPDVTIYTFNDTVVYAARKTDPGRAAYAARVMERVADRVAPRG